MDVTASEINGVSIYRQPMPNLTLVFDPSMMEDNYSVHVAYQIYDTLFKPDEFLSIQPNLAASWQQSDDAKKYLINLKPNVKFHDGKNLTSDDVIFTIERFIRANPSSYPELALISGVNIFLSGGKKHVSGLRKISDLSFEIILDQSNTTIPLVLSAPNFGVIPNVLNGKTEDDFFKHPVGTGPFQFGLFNSGASLELIANDNYFLGKPRLGKIIYEYATQQQAIEGFNKGSYHDLQWYNPDTSDIKTDYSVNKTPISAVTLLVFNTKRQPFNNKNIRLATSQLIDKNRLFNECFRDNMISTGVIPYGLGGFNQKDKKSSGEQKLKNVAFSKMPRDFTILRLENHPCHEKFDSIIKDNFKTSVLKPTVKYVTYQDFMVNYKNNRNYDILEIEISADYPEASSLLRYLKSDFTDNFGGFSSKQYDELITKAMNTFDKNERFNIYRQAQDLLIAEAVVIDLYYNVKSVIYKNSIKGIKIPFTLPSLSMRNVYFE